jgi:signal transduction histidine kinase/FixJ family two-component response regulator
VDETDELKELRRRVKELERSRNMLWALEQAAVAMAGELSVERVFEAIGTTLRELSTQTVVLRLDEDRRHLRVAYISTDPGVRGMLEKHIGVSGRTIAMAVEPVGFFRRVIGQATTSYAENTAEVAQEILPHVPRVALDFVLDRLGMAQMIGAPLVVGEQPGRGGQRGDRVWGTIILSSRELAPADLTAVAVFAHQVGWALHKAELLERLHHSLEEVQATQAQLLQAQKMEALGRLTGGIAHDLNNLLTAVLMSNELAACSIPEDSPARLELETIERTARRASELIKKLLTFSREQILRPQVVTLEQVMLGLGPLLQRLIGEDVQLQVDGDPSGRPWRTRVDIGQLEQVILNLVVNARDAMPEGGTLRIETRNVEADRAAPGGASGVRLSVFDTGSGLPVALLPRIFDPFFTTKPQGEGTGLGLSVAYGIVHQHGGVLTAANRPGGGAAFHVWLPVVDENDRVGAAAPRAIRGAALTPAAGIMVDGGRRVLLVEDEPTVRATVMRSLERFDMVFSAASTLDEARTLYAEGGVDILISDVILPDGNGIDLCEELHALDGDLAVVLVSGYTDARVDTALIEERGWAFLRKPFSTQDLASAIENVSTAVNQASEKESEKESESSENATEPSSTSSG